MSHSNGFFPSWTYSSFVSENVLKSALETSFSKFLNLMHQVFLWCVLFPCCLHIRFWQLVHLCLVYSCILFLENLTVLPCCQVNLVFTKASRRFLWFFRLESDLQIVQFICLNCLGQCLQEFAIKVVVG